MIWLQVLYHHPYPLPLHHLSSLPVPYLLPLAHLSWFKILCWGCDPFCWCQQWGMHRRPEAPEQSLCVSLNDHCLLAHLTHSSLLCSHHLQSSPNTAGLWWTLFLHERDGLAVFRRAKWVGTIWEASAKTLPTPTTLNITPSHCLYGQTALGEFSVRPLWLLALTDAHGNLLRFYCTGSIQLCC